MTTPYSAARADMHNDDHTSDDQREFTATDVAETLRDGVRGFQTAAEHVDTELSQVLAAMGERRRAVLDEFVAAMHDDDLDTQDDDGTPAGALHRAWIGVRDAVQGDSGVIASTINGEQHARDELNAALGRGLHTDLETIMQKAIDQITDNLADLGRRRNG